MNRREMLSTVPGVAAIGMIVAKLPVEKPGQLHTIEYVGDPGEFIYGLGIVKANGEIELVDETTFSNPAGDYPVVRADGTILSKDAYLKALDSV